MIDGKYQGYPLYKNSGTIWLGKVPDHWSVLPAKRFFRLVTDPAPDDNNFELLSVYTEIGVRPRKDLEQKGNKASTTDGYWLVKKGDVVVNKLLAWMGAVGHSEYEGVTSPAYDILRPKRSFNSKFYHYLFRNEIAQQEFKRWSRGIMEMRLRLYFEELGRILMPFPPEKEIDQITNFLDYETAKIDTLIDKQKNLIKLLKEKRQACVCHAVTKGLNKNVRMCDSGVEWLGEVPEHWEILYIKNLSTVKRGASPRPIDDQKYFDKQGEYSWVRIADVSKSGMHLTSTTQRLSDLGASLSVKLEAKQLFVSIAGTVGKPCITISKACIHDGFVYFPELKINNKFLYYIFEAGEAYLGLGKMGTQLNLNTETVGGIKVGMPPANEIDEIILAIENSNEKFDNLITKANKSIGLMLERRTVLISAAVTGKIDVRNWQPPKPSRSNLEATA